MPELYLNIRVDDAALLLTTLADIRNGYQDRDLADGWRDAAARIAAMLRANGSDDEGTWNEFTGEDASA